MHQIGLEVTIRASAQLEQDSMKHGTMAGLAYHAFYYLLR